MTVLQFGNNTVRLGATPNVSSINAPLSRLFLVGRTERGPVNEPTAVSNYEEFLAVFGKGSDSGKTDVAAQVALDYFEAVGRLADAVVVRLVEGAPSLSKEAEVVVATATDPSKLRVSFTAANPGLWGNNLVRSVRKVGTGTGATYTVEAREVVGGVIVGRKVAIGVTPDAAGVAKLNAQLAGLLKATFLPVADAAGVDFLNVATGVAPDVFLTFAGGDDSAQLSPETLTGTLNADSQERTGLWTVQSTEWHGGVLVVPGADTAEHAAIKLAWAARTSRFAPIEPSGDVSPSAALAEKQALEQLEGGSYGAFFYPRGRVVRPGGAVTKSALGFVAGLYVLAVVRESGYVAPPAGAIGLPDVQRAANGRDLLVHEVNSATLQSQGINTLVQRSGKIELQGLSLIETDALQPATDKVYERLILNTLMYDLGPVLGQFDNTYVDSQGVFFNVVVSKIRDRLSPYYKRGVLFGASVDEAFSVQMDFTLNNPADIAKTGRVNVKVKVRISPVGEGLDLEFFHVPVNVAL